LRVRGRVRLSDLCNGGSMGNDTTAIHPALVHATEVCGFVLTEMNADRFSDEELSQWEDAIDDYMAAHPEAPPL
jgi:hypothetical protein